MHASLKRRLLKYFSLEKELDKNNFLEKYFGCLKVIRRGKRNETEIDLPNENRNLLGVVSLLVLFPPIESSKSLRSSSLRGPFFLRRFKKGAKRMEKSSNLILDVNEFPKKKGQAIVLAIQHVLAMFVACITVPLIVYGRYTVNFGGETVSLSALMLPPTLVSAGIGTLFYLLVTKQKSPMFLASSFAYMAAMAEAIKVDGVYETLADGSVVFSAINLWILPVGMLMVCVVYCLIALLIKIFGVAWLNKLLPPIVVGPVIMVIGLGLAGSAIANLTSASGNGMNYNWCAIISGLFAMIVTALSAHYGKKILSLIPFLIGMVSGYLLAALFTGIGYATNNDYWKVIDFSPLVNLFSNIRVQSFLDYPKFLFLVGAQSNSVVGLSGSAIGQAALIFIPVSLVTVCEHIGDHKNMSGILQRDLLVDPGLSRTLIGDGVATGLSGILCGAANTTYGENVAVVGVTKIASVKVMIIACLMAIALGFLSPIMALTETIPACVTGGVSMILYGFIASSGVKMMINEKIDMAKTKNMFVASVILVAGIGGLVFSFATGKGSVSITSVSVAMILGIVMNLILREKKEKSLSSGNEI